MESYTHSKFRKGGERGERSFTAYVGDNDIVDTNIGRMRLQDSNSESKSRNKLNK